MQILKLNFQLVTHMISHNLLAFLFLFYCILNSIYYVSDQCHTGYIGGFNDRAEQQVIRRLVILQSSKNAKYIALRFLLHSCK